MAHMGDGFVLMRLAGLDQLPPAALPDELQPWPEGIELGWSRSVESSRADFVRLHREVGDEMGQDPEVFDSTFGCDPDVLAERMAFLYVAAAVPPLTAEPEPEPAPQELGPEPAAATFAVGTCTAWEVGGTGWIHSLAVGTSYQGRGLSKLLLRAVLRRLQEVSALPR